MRAGRLEYPLRLHEPVDTPAPTFVDRGLWWAEMRPLGGSAPGGVQAEAVHELHGHPRPGVTPRWRATFQGRVFRFRTVDRPTRDALVVVANETVGAKLITFIDTVQVRDDATGHVTPITTLIAGTGVQEPGDPERYKELELVSSTSPTIFFTPDVYGVIPKPGNTTIWAARRYTVRDVSPVAPNGYAIAARVIIAT